ncbi:membrane protein insertase YidC [Candidatus Pelagibacter sp.]|jgi:YidC/Oxa1 family membrane protein insertase|uniref:Membrane protein insertase YidC n=1 Tax=Pelagibacter ubique (strain HTCC1062) TaxID=335992 RepID=YIDC_PELUB|nr:membrane protein insertase YidC [Candidatus Pelagibacter ubique]Q4FNF1.1 RecName: Full=Membrane protein insertase YidC; AltName: Full=Foldase YidC; AltName: Full=Membrane integrase YidC; AltName: Full=Membrane protein YidC [Candidatus Pelagibacter ubique HTCC1062]MDA8861208.1 membrane protein insertase YidC [bacterium]MDB9774117.1 membrane protein insertase YidC [Candidatus Pelagibacter sp.]AAZ21288.1 60 kDa inner membrane protein [Candidatus Pelagibacter ubique HTCC1062]MDA7489185.1 membra
MDTRNVIAAISLSAAVIILYSLFFQPDPATIKKNLAEQNKIENNEDTPSLDKNENFSKLSRADALKENDRIQFENGSVVGSISLKGAAIDDLTFKEYNIELNRNEKITLLSPRNVEDGYLIESGFVSTNKNIDIPDASTVWEVSGNNKLTNNNPVKLTWSNTQGITFEKHISLDDQFLFTVKEKIINSSDKSYNFYSYGQIIRNELPEISGFYILHEGFLSVLDDELIEEDYDDIQDKKFTQIAQDGFVAISDKFWVTSVIPPKGKEFKTTFDYKNKFRANYISTKGIEVKANSSIEEKIQIIVAAKRVNVIDGYAENLNINKFDLAIDWGFMYFITKPLFFVLDYFFKLLGNYGLAIIAVTICIRLAFFPLANFSFKSMGKMKLLAPEMARLKELHKDDKMKLQQAMMALYKKEKVNPMSGCLPILVQIPVFFALYKVLFVTIEMRHMPFYGWIHDLSDRDPTSLFNVFGLIPWDPPSFLLIGAWPIIMGITMWIQQKLNPTPPDPIQAKIFMFFPVFLTVILAPFPAGLVIYWSFNNIFTMIQQYIVQRKMTIKTT